MPKKEPFWKVHRVVDVNHKPGLIAELMRIKQGYQRRMSADAFMVKDKFDYLQGSLDHDSDNLREAMGNKLHTGHPFIPRPQVWGIELHRIVRKAWHSASSFQPSRLSKWEKEFLSLGRAFEENYVDAGKGMWENMFRIQMLLKRGLPLNKRDQEFHKQVMSAIPERIKKEYKLE